MRFCNHCGKLLHDDEKCSCRDNSFEKREYKKPKTNFYQTKGWTSCSRFVRMRDYNMDRLQMYLRKYETANETEKAIKEFLIDATGEARKFDGRILVHHIEELEKAWDKRFDTDNLISLEYHVHEYIHKLYFTKEKEVKELLRKAVRAELP